MKDDSNDHKLYKDIMIYSISIIITLIIIYFTEPLTLIDYIAKIGLFGYLILVSLYLIDLIIRTIRWKLLLMNQGYDKSALPSNKLFFPIAAALIINLFTIARAGEMARLYSVKKECDVRYSDGLSTIAVEQSLSVIALLLVVSVTLSLISSSIIHDSNWQLLNTLILLLFVSSITMILILLVIMIWPGSFLRVIAILPKTIENKVEIAFKAFYKGLIALKKNKTTFLITLFLSSMIWIIEGIMLFFIVSGIYPNFGLINLPWAVGASCAGNITFIMPILPGAIGEYELIVGIILFVSPSHPTANVTAIAFLDRIIKTVILGLLGIPTIIKFGIKKELLEINGDNSDNDTKD